MTLALLCLGLGMMLLLAGVKGYSVRELATGNLQTASNQSLAQGAS